MLNNHRQRRSGSVATSLQFAAWVIAAGLVVAPVSLLASVEQEVGVIATSSMGPMGKPPLSPARDLDTGVEVYFRELVSTDANGRAQLLFQDGTALTVGPDSDLVIDQYVYDPVTGLGEMTIDISNGVFRLVGGKISKNNPITFTTPSSTVAIRGGVFTGTVTESKTDLVLLFGELQVTLASGEVSRTTVPGTNITASLSKNQLGSLSRKRVEPDRLTSLNKTLEKSAIQESIGDTSNLAQTPAATTRDNTDQSRVDLPKIKEKSTEANLSVNTTVTTSETSAQQKEQAKQVRRASSAATQEARQEARKELKKNKAALKKAREERRKERKAAGKTLAGDSDKLSGFSKKQQKTIIALSKDLSAKDPARVPGLTTTDFSRDSKEIAETGKVTSKSETGTDAPIVTDVDDEGDPIIGCDSEIDCASVTLLVVDDNDDGDDTGSTSTGSIDDGDDTGSTSTGSIDDGDDTGSTSTGSGSGTVIATSKLTKKEKKAAKKKAAAEKKAKKKAAVAKKKADKKAAKKEKAKKKAAAKAEKKKKKEAKAAAKKKAAEEKKKKKKKKKKCDESDPDCTTSRPTAIALLDDDAGATLRADAYAYGKPIGTVVSSGSSSALCNDCRFLNWQRQPLYVSGETMGLHYWVQGASATAKDLAAAAGKTAAYQGGMIGSVAESGALREKTGHFSSRVDFGVSHYQVTNFNADFDRNRFSGSSAATPNSQPFGVTAGALSGRDGISDLSLNASGYFGGTPATPGAPPPEMGGSFSITGGDYSANGVFVGRQ